MCKQYARGREICLQKFGNVYWGKELDKQMMHFKSTSLPLDWPIVTWAFHFPGRLLRTHYCVILVQLIQAVQSNFSEWTSVVKGLINVLMRKFCESDWKPPRNSYSLPPPLTTTWALLWSCLVFRTQNHRDFPYQPTKTKATCSGCQQCRFSSLRQVSGISTSFFGMTGGPGQPTCTTWCKHGMHWASSNPDEGTMEKQRVEVGSGRELELTLTWWSSDHSEHSKANDTIILWTWSFLDFQSAFVTSGVQYTSQQGWRRLSF